jgi:hypothetical protein
LGTFYFISACPTMSETIRRSDRSPGLYNHPELRNSVVSPSRSALQGGTKLMDTLTIFGLFAVTMMLVCYAAEDRSPWFILAFAVACALGSAYGFLQGAWPFGLVEAIWAVVALRRWMVRRLPAKP